MVQPETDLFNRELSWLRFNARVLHEAQEQDKPLLERLKFLSIFSSNLDEFFMIRVAGLHEQESAGITKRSPDGLTAGEQLEAISQEVRLLMRQHARVLNDDILPALEEERILIRDYSRLNRSQKEQLSEFFTNRLFPVITPLALAPNHPLPQLRGLAINLLVQLKSPFAEEEPRIAVVPIPAATPRFLPLIEAERYVFVPIEQVVRAHMPMLFPNMTVLKVNTFRLTRNADLDISEDEAEDLLKLIERELRKRRLGSLVRMEVNATLGVAQVDRLQQTFGLQERDVFRCQTFLGVDQFMQLYNAIDRPDLKYPPFTPAPVAAVEHAPDIFAAVRFSDILLHHPYDSFQPVIELVQQAARDPQVVAIKQTLYRTSGNSPIVSALREAASNGINVTAMIELKARFDEENNIIWAKELERSGANVVYGMIGLKTHCKMTLIVRREGEVLRNYVHLSTGNYNEKTARLYTDYGLLTCNEALGLDVAELFNLLTGYSRQEQWRKVLVAPINMREEFYRLIGQCIHAHSPQHPSRIRLTMNSLVDPAIIRQLYKASQSGVEIDLLVRGACCLMPGQPGLSETIRVRSIVGRFLEHTRVFEFRFADQHLLYLGSADWMQRNLNHRIEVVFPVEDAGLKQRVDEILELQFGDTLDTHCLEPDGDYQFLGHNPEIGYSAQSIFLQRAEQRHQQLDTIYPNV
jgi:polyphosphate kinase